ncbi:hypothetical protein LN650_03220 [Klebsiella pneumoniae subsp. pneumoniae]|nr:hypothetical protein [Klebsiella pneumoniae subsp. pneumoniae]
MAIELAFIGTDALAKSMAEIIQANLRQARRAGPLVGEEESSIYARQRRPLRHDLSIAPGARSS